MNIAVIVFKTVLLLIVREQKNIPIIPYKAKSKKYEIVYELCSIFSRNDIKNAKITKILITKNCIVMVLRKFNIKETQSRIPTNNMILPEKGITDEISLVIIGTHKYKPNIIEFLLTAFSSFNLFTLSILNYRLCHINTIQFLTWLRIHFMTAHSFQCFDNIVFFIFTKDKTIIL